MSLVATRRLGGRSWAWLIVVAVVIALLASVQPDMFNPGGVTQWSRFWAASLSPRLDAEFLALTAEAALTTIAFAAVGTGLAMVIGLLGGVLSSETWWRRNGGGRPGARWRGVRILFAFPRGIHEAIWGLVFVLLLGRDPLVGVLAIAIPFGAITAKVYADILDDTPHDAYDTLRAGGAGRLTAMAYSLLPSSRGDMISYAFYRFECAIRSAVILGIIGAGGLGFELMLSFQSLRYDEMWTLIAGIVLLSAGADAWSGRLRSRPTPVFNRITAVTSCGLVVLSVMHLDLFRSRWSGGQITERVSRLVSGFWPPEFPSGGLVELGSAMGLTLQMSILAMALAAGLGVIAAFLAARSGGPMRRVVSSATRGVLLVIRSIPPPVWALVFLFVLFPGPLPGALALGVYTLGILGRLMAEAVENLNPEPRMALEAAGATSAGAFLYSTLPQAAPRMLSLSMYRWEVAIRETVVVGLVGAGGLGRLLASQNAAFAHSQMLTTILAYIVLSVLVDFMSAAIRRSTG